MTHSPHPANPDCPHWYRGLPLEERLQQVEAIGVEGDSRSETLCERRKKRWQAQPPLTNIELYDRRLKQIGLTLEQWLNLLGETAASLARRCPSPPWLEQLNRAFTHPDRNNIQIASVEDLPDERASAGFLQIVKPLCSDAIARLEQGIEILSQTAPHLPFNPRTIKGILFAPMPEMLGSMLAQTMVLELNVARLQGQLSGVTPRARLASFIQQLANPERAVTLLQEYPVLARQLTVTLEQWVESSLECLKRLCADWDDLCNHYQTEPGELVKLHQGAGDRHLGGRSVAILEFSSGFKLVYKPKSLAIDGHLQDLFSWLNQQGLEPAFPLLNILNRERYGWVEFISAATCHETEEIERFYERVGGYLALMYVLEATDFHLENLIAAGEYPVLIDLETLFRPEILDRDAPESRLIANQKMGRSVMSVGLLPQRTAVKAGTGVDLSGIGAVGKQTLPNRRLQLTGGGSDAMRLDRQSETLAATQNRPHLNGKPVQGWQYRDSILQGFTRLYRLLWEKREELLQVWLPRFANDEIRVVLRDTRVYGLLLQESFHPDLLRDALERDRFFDRLWVDVPLHPSLARAIPLEQKALWRGDIPFFSTCPGSGDLRGEGGVIPDFFQRSGLERVQEKLVRLSDRDLQEQLGFIEQSLTGLAMESKEVSIGKNAVFFPDNAASISTDSSLSEQLLAAVRPIVLHLESLALRDRDRASWIGLCSLGEKSWSLKPLAWDLFGGLPGIALFFAYWGKITADPHYTQLARDVLETILLQVQFDRPLMQNLGAFNGWGGLIYTLTHLGHLWQREDLYELALDWARQLPPLIEKDDYLDIVAGSAGCILALIGLYSVTREESLKPIAAKCGDRLLQKAQSLQQGIGWATIPQQPPLSGFSHGAAGIALALGKLAEFTGETHYKNAAFAAWEYERSLFSAQQKNWSKSFEDGDAFTVGWNYGATGIGLARLAGISVLKDTQTNSEIQTALDTMIALGFDQNHSLCSGYLGSLEFLLQGLQFNPSSQLNTVYRAKITELLNNIQQRGYYCGTSGGVEVLGLMTGLAGIGYGLLRCAYPQEIPSLILLEPPV